MMCFQMRFNHNIISETEYSDREFLLLRFRPNIHYFYLLLTPSYSYFRVNISVYHNINRS